MTLAGQWIEGIRRNPSMLKDMVIAGGGLGVAYGLDITAEQLAQITAVVLAVWGPLARQQMTSIRDPKTTVNGELVPLVPAEPDNPI